MPALLAGIYDLTAHVGALTPVRVFKRSGRNTENCNWPMFERVAEVNTHACTGVNAQVQAIVFNAISEIACICNLC